MTTTETTTTETTAEIGGNLFKLDALIEAYGAILEQAKAQLEAFEPTEEQFQAIAHHLGHRINYGSLLNEAQNSEGFMEAVAGRTLAKISEDHISYLIRRELRSVVDTEINRLRVELKGYIMLKIDEEYTPRVDNATNITHACRILLANATKNGTEELISEQVQEEVRRQLQNNTVQQQEVDS